MRELEAQAYWNLCGAEHWKGGVYRSVERCGDSLQLSEGAFEGVAFLPPLDSGETDFRWGRVKLQLELPRDASVRIYARASDEREWGAWQQAAGPARGAEAARSLFGEPKASCGDVWLSERGRWLWLAIGFASGGADAVSVLAESDHLTDYLPAIYQESEFTYRFLSVFTAMLQDLEERIGQSRRQLDPASADPEMLRYLAHWLCADRNLPEPEQNAKKPNLSEYSLFSSVAPVMPPMEKPP